MDIQQDHAKSEEPKRTAATPVETKRSAPLRQLLHWATGDREAEAKALADETLAQRDPEQKGSSAADEKPDEAVLSAAKGAVSQAHGDSLVPNEFSESSSGYGASTNTNLLSKWEEASSFSPEPSAEGDSNPNGDSDVARPPDVEQIVEADPNP